MLAGVDDAGRGPIIGPMVLAGVKINDTDEAKLLELGCKDSKLLKREVRERLVVQIEELAVQTQVAIVQPAEIDEALRHPDSNLNDLEANHFARIINVLTPHKVIIDCPSPNIRAYHAFISKQLTSETHLLCEHKADLHHPIVAAASIIAKVTRDRIIEQLHKEFGDFGSGYLSDPKTQAFLREHWQRHAMIFRQTWNPYKALVAQKQQRSLEDF